MSNVRYYTLHNNEDVRWSLAMSVGEQLHTNSSSDGPISAVWHSCSIVSRFWFARLSVDGNEYSLARSSAIHNIVGVVAQRHPLAATAIKMVAL